MTSQGRGSNLDGIGAAETDFALQLSKWLSELTDLSVESDRHFGLAHASIKPVKGFDKAVAAAFCGLLKVRQIANHLIGFEGDEAKKAFARIREQESKFALMIRLCAEQSLLYPAFEKRFCSCSVLEANHRA